MKKLFFHLLTFVCAGFTLLLAPGCNDDEGEKTGPTGDEGKEIYSLSVTPDKLEFQSTKQTVEVTVTTNGPIGSIRIISRGWKSNARRRDFPQQQKLIPAMRRVRVR